MFHTSYDGFQFITDDPVFAESISRGTTEPYPYDLDIVKRYLRVFPTRCNTYIDIGAHIGTTIAPYSRIFKNIVGFEANPKTFEFLKKNIEQNNINCLIESNGLYSHACKGNILQHGGGNSGCYYFQESENGEVECKRLDDYNFENVDFIKIDTEGSELYVLQGAEQTIRKWKPLLQIECNSLSDSLYGIQRTIIIEYLSSLGYFLYNSGSPNLFFYYPRIEPYSIFCFWTGTTSMSNLRMNCFEKMKESECNIVLVTPENLNDYILQEFPLHPAFQYLSDVHKSDYLRTYFMHHYGGGYSDIKLQGGSWKQAFDDILNSDAYINGYRESSASDIAYPPVAPFWEKLVGNGAYICRPKTPLTKQWVDEMNQVLDRNLEELKKCPASHPRDSRECGTGYPIEWNEMLGRIFHKICFSYQDKILQTVPRVSLFAYL